MSNKSSRTRARSPRREQSTHSSGGHRQKRLEHLLLDETRSLIRDEASDPSLAGIRLASMWLSPDGSHARIGYTVEAPLSEEAEAAHRSKAALERATGFLHARLASGLNLKRTPKLRFVFMGVVEPSQRPDGAGGEEWSG